MPFPGTPRSSFGHAVEGGRVYLAGGHLGAFHRYPEEAFSAEFHSVDLGSGSR
jgi:hypothetical protein